MYNDFTVIRFGVWYCGRDNQGRGLVAFSGDLDEDGKVRPYMPVGGKGAWDEIKAQGGFLNLSGMEFIPEPREMYGQLATVCD